MSRLRIKPLVLAACAALFFGFPSLGSARVDDLPPESAPYRVSLAVAFAEIPEFSPGFRTETCDAVRRLLDRSVGERWAVESIVASADGPGGLASLAPPDVPVPRSPPNGEAELGFAEETAPDKFLFASAARDGARFAVSAREWDRLTDTVGPVRRVDVATRDEIPRAIVSALFAAFRSVAAVDEPQEGTVTLRRRAAAIAAPDPGPSADLLAVVFRRFDRDGRLTEIRPVPHTYLRTLEGEGSAGTASAAVLSALRRPLSARRGRVEAWAVAALEAHESTTLRLTRRGDDVPLAGRVVELRPQAPTPGREEPAAERSALTDRSGAVSIPVDPGRPLVWLTIRSGAATLARIPLAPGLEPEVIVRVGDDQRRIDAESRIAIVTGDLIETVAKRATLLAKARADARAGRYERADAALAEAGGLPDVVAFRRRIAAIEAPAAEAAEREGDRAAAARIRALGRNAVALVDRYLAPEAVNLTREEVAELKRTDPDRK